MRNAALFGTFGAGVVLTAAVAWWLWPQTSEPLQAPVAAVQQPAPAPATPAVEQKPLTEDSPPWGALAPADTATTPPPAGQPQAAQALPGSPVNAEKNAELQQRLNAMALSGKPDIKELDGLLGELQANAGSSVVNGVKVDVLRENLRKAAEIEALSKQIEMESQKAGGSDPQIMQGYLKQLQTLQGQLRLDFMVPPVAAPAR